MKILVLGATGMLGNAMLRLFAQSPGFSAVGTARSPALVARLPEAVRPLVRLGVDVESHDQLVQLFERERPDVVVNAIGLIKQLSDAKDPLAALPVNALLPHRLARLAALAGARLVHVSTDCVFSGSKGGYAESDFPDADDLYGRSKLLGEVDYPNAVTLRTSIIGCELGSANALVGWFLAQPGPVKGFRRALFSGLPTVVLAEVVRDHVLPRPDMRGLWHVSAEPIDKFTLLSLVRDAWGRDTQIEPYDDFVIDRSLNSDRFRAATGWQPPAWPDLIARMRAFG